MQLHADFRTRVLLHADELDWTPSPMAGVHRRMLDRIGDEVARATTIVRYAPGSSFSAHVHGGGEEFVVLEGVFQDEHGDYPVGSYVRNPPTSRHTPGSEPGTVIFVKLRQFQPDDRQAVSVHMPDQPRSPRPAWPGVHAALLFQDPHERVEYQRWSPDASVNTTFSGGAELLVLAGHLVVDGDPMRAQSWMRIPDAQPATLVAGHEGATVWVKTGHLLQA